MSAKKVIDFSTCIFDDFIKKPYREIKENTVLNSNNISIVDDTINGIYNDDLNILYIDDFVKQNIKKSKKYLNEIKVKLILSKEKIKDKLPYLEKTKLLKQIKSLENSCLEIENDEKYNQYISQTRSILERYSEIGVKKNKIVFGNDIINKTILDPYRIGIVKEYLSIVEKYYPINIIFNIGDREGCKNCGSLNVFFNSDFVKQCEDCNSFSQTMITEDETLINKKYPGLHDDEKSIRDKFSKIQGKGTSALPKNLKELLDDYFTKNNLPTSDEVKRNKLDEYGIRKGTDIEMMRTAFKELGLSDYYSEIYRVCGEIWGWKLLNIDDVYEQFLLFYRDVKEVFENIKGDERSSSLNSDYTFFRVLEHLDLKVSPNYFNIVKTPKTFEYHEDIWEKICENLGLETPKPLEKK